ncbi:class I adenylate-forming enzyme family protein [Lysinibacillus sp. LZ02]|uniref:class I adenylate-forming enzyme family protein n=1 Tax=Lysinibacillus sp. LZ02 TaxID=3420668 RepID=UPI003D35F039
MRKQPDNPKLYNQMLPHKMDIPNVPVGAVLKGAAKYYGERTAYLYRGFELSYSKLYEQALRFANGLQKRGYGKGDVIAVQMQNCTQYVVAYYGILLAGATYTPVNPMLPKDDLIFQMKDSRAKAIVTYGPLLQLCLDLPSLTNIELIITTDDVEVESIETSIDVSAYGNAVISFNQLLRENEPQELHSDINGYEDIAHLAYTGGTTGRSKGVIITHNNLISNIVQSGAWSAAVLPQVDDDGALTVKRVETDPEKYLKEYPTLVGTNIRLSPAPFSHGAGAMGGMVYSVLFAATTIIFERFIPEEFLRLIEEHQVTEVSGAPAMFNFLLFHPDMEKRNFSCVRTINSGAAPIAPETMQLLMKYFPNAVVTEGYGLTEATASTVQSVGFYSGERKLGTVGLPIYNTEVKLMSVDGPDREEIQMPGERGEVIIRGPQVMKGYLNNPEATAETLIDGWLYTGDIGVFDESGFLSIVDRKKDMLIYNGYNVYPRYIEEILYEHPAVQAAVVIGVEDPKVGEKPKAFIVLRPGVTANEEEIMEFVNTKVVHYSKVREVEFIDQLPMTAAGKISKVKLVELEKTRLKQ